MQDAEAFALGSFVNGTPLTKAAIDAAWIQRAEAEGYSMGRDSAMVNNVMLRTLDTPHQRSDPKRQSEQDNHPKRHDRSALPAPVHRAGVIVLPVPGNEQHARDWDDNEQPAVVNDQFGPDGNGVLVDFSPVPPTRKELPRRVGEEDSPRDARELRDAEHDEVSWSHGWICFGEDMALTRS